MGSPFHVGASRTLHVSFPYVVLGMRVSVYVLCLSARNYEQDPHVARDIRCVQFLRRPWTRPSRRTLAHALTGQCAANCKAIREPCRNFFGGVSLSHRNTRTRHRQSRARRRRARDDKNGNIFMISLRACIPQRPTHAARTMRCDVTRTHTHDERVINFVCVCVSVSVRKCVHVSPVLVFLRTHNARR